MRTLRWLGVLFLAWLWPALAAAAPAAQIGVDFYHLTVMPEGAGAVRVTQGVRVTNEGQAVEQAAGLSFALPAGYRQLQMERGLDQSNARVEANRLVYTGPVPPGELALGFSYALDSSSPHFNIPLELPLGADTLYVLVPPAGVTVEGLPDQGPVDMGDRRFRLYGATQVPAGTSLALRLTVDAGAAAAAGGVTRTPPPAFHNPGHIRFWKQSPFRGINAHLFLVIVIAAPLAALAFYLSRRHQAAGKVSPAEREEEVFQRLRQKEQALLQKLASLEEQHSRGEVDARAYEELREAYRRRLVKVKAQLRGFTD